MVEGDDTPAVCEQVEVTSSNDDEITETVNVHKEPTLSSVLTELSTNTVIKQSTKQCTTVAPLPRKKRPLPKEFLDLDQSVENKKPRSEQAVTSCNDVALRSSPSSGVIVTSSPSCTAVVTSSSASSGIVTSLSSSDTVVTSSTYHLNTTTATTLTTSLSSSVSFGARNSQNSSCTMLTSSVYSSPVSTTTSSSVASSTTTSQEGPRVVVEKNKLPSFHSLWSWTLPVTCTQPRLSKWLMEGVCKSQLNDISGLRNSSIQSAHLNGLVAY